MGKNARTPSGPSDHPFVARMREHKMPEEAIDTFRFHLERVLCGETGFLTREQIEPIYDLPRGERLEEYRTAGEEAMHQVAMVKLNGGLGTTMGLSRAKSLIRVKNGFSFLDLIVRQTLWLRQRYDAPLPLVFMNSFRTEEDTLEVLADYPDLQVGDLPLSFVQHRIPKIVESTMSPAVHEGNPELEWCPPGHGDLYTSLVTSGMLERLLDRGVTYVFVSNADNLGAIVDPGLLGYMVETGADFMIEVARRSEVDRKGGHLCRTKDGRIALREAAQAPPEEREEFQDTHLYRYFNTNNIWIHLPALKDLLSRHGNVLPLSTIVNRKNLDPRDPSSPRVIQLETALGSAVSLFPHATAVHVGRTRFSPVKTTNDLLAVRSDAYELTKEFRVALATPSGTPPRIDLDPGFYGRIDHFEERFPSGPPSLKTCLSLSVRGNVVFGPDVIAAGNVEILAGTTPATIPPGSHLTGTIDLRSTDEGASPRY